MLSTRHCSAAWAVELAGQRLVVQLNPACGLLCKAAAGVLAELGANLRPKSQHVLVTACQFNLS
jgi:hypothetical protein